MQTHFIEEDELRYLIEELSNNPVPYSSIP